MLKNKIFWIVILVIVLAFAGIWFLKVRSSSVEVRVARVEKANILSTISASGLVRANSVALGSARMAGRVDWVGVEEGARVIKGQVLVKLDGYNQAEKEYQRLKKLHAQGFVSDLELERAKQALENSEVVAPFAGVVTEKAVTPGEAISPGVPIMSIVDIDHPWLEIQVDEVDISVAKVGQRVRFTTDAFPDEEFFGRIVWLNDRAELKKVGGRVRLDEEDLVFRGKVAFEDGRENLRPGMSVYAEIITGEQKDVVAVPRESITLRSGKRVAFVLNDGRVRAAEVDLGIKDAVKVEIIKGLKVGQLVAVSNLDNLKDRSRVLVVKDNNK
ncbi:MAG: efflux RND transporter periplasmic adaptor subunit [Candidatus Saganbacteria bacterium]|nr:efflux RND transporter periplasmic adaptor subunit [Candidatus Saganbacteria bacterium]